jgi:hypothetical protein
MSDRAIRQAGLAPGQIVDTPGHPPFVVAAHEPDGFMHIRAVSTAPAGVAARNDLASVPLTNTDVSILESRALAWRHAKLAAGLNEIRISPVSASHSRATRRLNIQSAVSDFASHAAVREFVAGAPMGRKRLWYSAGICPPLSHGIATSLAVVTSDMYLLLVRRSATSLAGGTWDVGIGESQSAEDLSVDADGRLTWNPNTTARRGLREELGVRRLHHLTFHTLAVNLADGSTSLFGVAYVPISAEDLRVRIASLGEEELDGIDFIPWSLDAAAAELPRRHWAPWAAAKLVTTAVFCAGPSAAQRAGLLG